MRIPTWVHMHICTYRCRHGYSCVFIYIYVCIYIRHRASAREHDGSRHLLLVLILWSSGLLVLVALGPGPLVLGVVLGFWMFLREGPTLACMAIFIHAASFLCNFCWHRLGTPFSEFWCQLGPKLPANLAPKSIQNQTTRNPNSKQTCIMASMPYFIDVGSLLGRFLYAFGAQVEGQVDKKSIIWLLVGKLTEIVEC